MEEQQKGEHNHVNQSRHANEGNHASQRMLQLNDFLSKFQYSSNTEQTRKIIKEGAEDMREKKAADTLTLPDVSDDKQNLPDVKKEENTAANILKNIPEEIIRPELNIEKHADFIFIPAHSKKVRQPRRREGWVTLTDGSKQKSYLEIAPVVGGKTPTTTTRKIYLALQRLYEEKQQDEKLQPDGSMVLSSKEIANAAMLSWAGSKTIRAIHEEISTLRKCIFEWVNTFVAPNGEKYEVLDHANIVDKYKYVSKKERHSAQQQFNAAHQVRFSEHIRNNLEANKTKPVNYTTVMSIQGELALVLYTRLDIILADKDQYSRKSKGLFEDINIAGEREYKYPFGRKRKLEKAIKELDGKCISTGILKLKLERTADGADWKLIARKISVLPAPNKTKQVPFANLPVMVPILAQDIGDVVGSYNQNQRLYETLAIHYPADWIYQAISEYKADAHEVKSPARFFLSIIHRIAHQRGREWIKPCDEDCKHRPQKKSDP